jgi:transcriptional regulator with GAF, ATPase, and Fis domain
MDDPIKTIDGKYRVVTLLGGGGFSEVYLVEGPGGRCALKLLKGDIASLKKSTLDEFKNEFAVLKDMRHPHIASILDFGFDAEQERYYYTSELIEGRELVRATKGMPLATVTDLFVQALRALSYLHSYRIYHFDIKAANLLVVGMDKPEIKIIDFGLAGIDPGGRLIGTPSYMAPEIVAREHADGRADLYSLGVLWYYAIVGKNPFRSRTSTETLERQLKFVPPPPSGIVPTVPAWLDVIIMRLIEKNPANRFSSASAVIREINRLANAEYPLETRETLLSYLPDEGRFVGRDAELSAIEADLMRVKGAGGCGGAWVTGAAGTGKTRLLKEVKYRSQLTGVRIEWTSAQDADVFGCWCDLLARHLSEGEGLTAFMLDDAQVALSDEVMRTRLLALLARASRPSKGASVWVVLAARPSVDEGTQASVAALLPLHIEMKPFSSEEMTEYIVSLTGLDVPPDQLLRGLFERTEGNPLFLTELIKSLIEGGGLFDDKGRWNDALFEDMGVDFSKAAMPGTLGGLLLERTRDIGDEGGRLVKALAALARPASAAELGAYAALGHPGQTVMDLLGRGLLDRAEGFRVRFHNALLGQAVYETMSREEREAAHDRIAEALKEAGGNDAEVLRHVSLGSHERAACDAALRLGERMLAQGLGEQAAALMNRALDRIDAEDVEKRVEVELKLGEALLISHDYAAATERFSAVEVLISSCAVSEGMARWRAEVLARIGGTYIKLQEFDRARAAFHDARGALEKAGGDARLAVTIENFLGSIKFLEGHLDEARRIFEASRVKAARLSAEDADRITNNDLGMVLVTQGDLGEAERILGEDLGCAQRVGDDLLIGRALYNMAQLASARGDYDGAIASYRTCIDVCRNSHNSELLLRAYNGLGNAYQIKADPDQSLAFYDRGLALYERTGDLRGGAAIAINMGIVEAQRGRCDAALDHLVPAVEYLRSLAVKTASDWTAFARGLLELGDIAKESNELDDAREKLEQARGVASKIPQAASLRFWILATMAEVAFMQGREGELSDIMGMLGPLATGDAEATTFEKLKARFGKGERSTGVTSFSRSVDEPLSGMVEEKTSAGATRPYRRILDINKLIAAESDLDYVLKTVLYYALDFTKADAGAILLIDPEGTIRVACERNLEARDDTVAFSETLARQVLVGGEPVRTDDALTDERFASEESVCAHALRSILCLPVKARRRIIGALYLENRFQIGAFSSADMVLLDAFTDQVGLAIETARLLKASARKEESLANELAEASRRAEHYEEMLKQSPVEYRLDYGVIAGRSPGMQRILRTLDKIADTEISIFICGESGTGKELIARALHEHHSTRAKGRFVAINCGAIPATLIESELFGYKAGAFTGASRDKKGLVEEASGGTLFLDEAGELRSDLQVNLLRVLQERECVRLGETEPRAVDVRVIAASNRDIEAMLGGGEFREDLYYRICQMKLEVPPLRERPEDIPFLVERFLAEASSGRAMEVSPRLMKRFLSYRWPGNVRELENLIQVLCALAEGETLDVSDIPDNHPLRDLNAVMPGQKSFRSWAPSAVGETGRAWPNPAVPGASGVMMDASNAYDPSKSWKEYERVIMAKCYAANDFRVRPAAAELDIAPATLYSRIREFALDDRSNAVYRDRFIYERGRALASHLLPIFGAALTYAGGVAKDAIANLRVSQGFFYKVMRKRTEV